MQGSALFFMYMDLNCFDGDMSCFLNSITGIDAKVGKDLADLRWGNLDRSVLYLGNPGKRDVFTNQTSHHQNQILYCGIQVKNLCCHALSSGKSKELPGQLRRVARCFLNDLEICIRAVFTFKGQFGMPENHHQHIVEVMGNASRKLPYNLHLLGVLQLSLQLLTL